MALTGAIMFFVVTSSFLLVTSYLMATLPFPLQDQALNDIDLMLGFHFETFVAMLNQNETVVKILQICYDTKILQFLTIAVILSKSKPEYIIEFCYLFLVTLIVTFIIYMFIPAAGA
ncbi:MAG: phosphatase PAP2 family protein, partial [OCS116 cluster bacterium]|nr:phosphatase PAP2 family protein [OCS116 cluster bacterium]